MPVVPISRRCRACGRTATVDIADTACPRCGQAYGPITFGLDYDPAEPTGSAPYRGPQQLPRPVYDPDATSQTPCRTRWHGPEVHHGVQGPDIAGGTEE